MHRKWRTLFLATLLVLGLCLPSASAAVSTSAVPGFADVPPTHWAYPAVMRLLDAGVIAQSKDGLFRPDEEIKRSELFKMALAARRIDMRAACREKFSDVPCWAWYAPVAETAYGMAIAEGKGDDTFAPDGSVSREELFTIVIRSVGRRWEAANLGWQNVTALLSRFSDKGDFHQWSRPSVALAVRDGLTSGYADGTFRPLAATSRAEAAALISKILLPTDGVESIEVDGRQVTFKKAFNMTASMYATGEPGVGDTTYTGIKVRIGTVAVDPKVIPLGSLLYVEGYGYAVAADIGGAIKGNRIDLYTFSYDEAQTFGLQPRRVWLLP